MSRGRDMRRDRGMRRGMSRGMSMSKGRLLSRRGMSWGLV